MRYPPTLQGGFGLNRPKTELREKLNARWEAIKRGNGEEKEEKEEKRTSMKRIGTNYECSTNQATKKRTNGNKHIEIKQKLPMQNDDTNKDKTQEPQKAITISRKNKRNREKQRKIQKQEKQTKKGRRNRKTDRNTYNTKQAGRH